MSTERFTAKAEQVLLHTQTIAKEMGHSYIGSEHLLLALCKEEESVAARFLESHGIFYDKTQNAITDFAGTGTPTDVPISDMTPKTRRIIEVAAHKAVETDVGQIGTEHLLYAVLLEKDSIAHRLLLSMGVSLSDLEQEVAAFINRRPASSDGSYTSPLDSMVRLREYGRDLTLAASRGKIDPLIGREQEVARVIRILCRRQKNNPCLIGEPGVGKTAIAEGLARRIAENDVPTLLENKAVILLDLSAMVAGAKYRGEFEDRLKGVLEEIRHSDRIILFIDEIHTIVGAGAAEGAVDAANILKPALARGEIRVIGATTLREYRLHIEKDAALERRFQAVTVQEPSEQEAVCMLMGVKERYEKHHQVRITEDAVIAAVRLSARYLPDRFLPDKAFDLLDEAASEVHIAHMAKSKESKELEAKLASLTYKKLTAIQEKDFKVLAALREQEAAYRQMRQQLEERTKQGKEPYAEVCAADIARVLTRQTGIPTEEMEKSEEERLFRLEDILKQKIVGQDRAVKTVSDAVKRARLGFADATRPIGCFLFTGPSGVGKTALSLALAEVLFGGKDALLRFDMSEYMEKHSVSKLIGSPPGYVGHDEGGQLTEKIRRHPYAVVLFDEIEKAHPDITHLLLQIMEDGALTDALGRRVNFSNAIIILTSNIGTKSGEEGRPLGFTASKPSGTADAAVKKYFSPELLGRLDEIVAFEALSEQDLTVIAAGMLEETRKRMENSGISVKFEEGLAAFLAKSSCQSAYGARPLRRAIRHQIEDRISAEILSGHVQKGSVLYLRVQDREIRVEQAEKAPF